MTSEEVSNRIEEETKKIKSSNSFQEMMELQNNIIQLKINSQNKGHMSEIYVDIKLFITYYIKSLDERKYNYDELRLTKIYYHLNFLSVRERIKLLNYLQRQLAIHGYDELVDECDIELADNHIKSCIAPFVLRRVPKLIYYLSTYNLYTILLSFFIIYTVTGLVLLPAPDWSIQAVTVKYHNYTDIFFVNHLLNIIGGPLELSEEYSVVPLNPLGFCLVFFGKVAFVILVLNVLLKQIEEKLK